MATPNRALPVALILCVAGPVTAGDFESFGPGNRVWDVSADGRVVVGQAEPPGFFRWTAGDFRVIAPPAGFINTSFVKVSPSGALVVGYGAVDDTSRGWIWSEEAGFVLLGDLDGEPSRILPSGVSSNGVVVGTMYGGLPVTPFRWTAAEGFELVDPIEGFGTVGRFLDVSADGETAVGLSTIVNGTLDVAALSVGGGQMTALAAPSGDSVANGVSPDGTVIVGDTVAGGALWRSGAYTPLPGLDRALFSTADGKIVLGTGDCDSSTVWTEDEGTTCLLDFVAARGGSFPDGWTSLSALISSDGRVLAGNGRNPDGQVEGWRLELEVDTDGDGLLDSWESEGGGLDVNGDGTVDLDLYAMGARPDRQDTFVEIDVMPGVPYTQTAIQMVIDAFADAPVDNPDGSTGITLHIDFDSIDDLPFQETFDETFVAYDTFKDLYFGTAQERVDDNWEHIRAARREVFRYCIFANEMSPTPAWGIGEQPGNDFFITMGGATREDRLIASTFMHELGHNLGLGHGGGDDVNRKCNYVSVMSYAFDNYVDIWGDPLEIDFSREATTPLDEANLDETIGRSSSEYADVMTYHSYDDGMGGRGKAWSRVHTPFIDWNDDGQYDQGVAVDLNWFDANENGTPGEILNAYNDWELLELPLAETGDFNEYVHETPDPSQEITQEIYDWYQAEIPPAPAPCRADITRDRAIDFADLLAILDAWGSCEGECPADLDGDGVVTIDDLLLVLAGWGPCG